MLILLLDANIWVSAAAYPGGPPSVVLGLIRAGIVGSVTSEAIIDQVRRALIKVRVSPEGIAEMRERSRIVAPELTLSVITAKESDNRILEVAIAGNADVIVTGDRLHLLPLGSYAGIPILTPADFLARYPLNTTPEHQASNDLLPPPSLSGMLRPLRRTDMAMQTREG